MVYLYVAIMLYHHNYSYFSHTKCIAAAKIVEQCSCKAINCNFMALNFNFTAL